MKKYDEKVLGIVREHRKGYSRIDFALAYASWVVHDCFDGAFSKIKIRPRRISYDKIGVDWTKIRYKVTDPAVMSIHVKKAATIFGASLVGICKLKENWLYADVAVPRKLENLRKNRPRV